MEVVIVRNRSLGILDQVDIDSTGKISLTLCQSPQPVLKKGLSTERVNLLPGEGPLNFFSWQTAFEILFSP